MLLHEILNLEGIVIRKIPKEVVERSLTSPERTQWHINSGGEFEIDSKGRTILINRKFPRYGGKYLIMFSKNTNSMLIYSKRDYGVGCSIEEAYQDYLLKH